MDVAELWVKVTKLGHLVVGAVEPIIASTIRTLLVLPCLVQDQAERCDYNRHCGGRVERVANSVASLCIGIDVTPSRHNRALSQLAKVHFRSNTCRCIPMFASPETAPFATFLIVSGAAFDKVQPRMRTPKLKPPAVLKKMAANRA